MKQGTHEAGHTKSMLWENPEGQGGERGGRRVQDGRDIQTVADSLYIWQKSSQYCNYPPIKINK